MIRVTIEMLPGGSEADARVIATANIRHIGPYGVDRRGYEAEVTEDRGVQDKSCAWRGRETISHRPRDAAVALVAKALTRLVERRR